MLGLDEDGPEGSRAGTRRAARRSTHPSAGGQVPGPSRGPRRMRAPAEHRQPGADQAARLTTPNVAAGESAEAHGHVGLVPHDGATKPPASRRRRTLITQVEQALPGHSAPPQGSDGRGRMPESARAPRAGLRAPGVDFAVQVADEENRSRGRWARAEDAPTSAGPSEPRADWRAGTGPLTMSSPQSGRPTRPVRARRRRRPRRTGARGSGRNDVLERARVHIRGPRRSAATR